MTKRERYSFFRNAKGKVNQVVVEYQDDSDPDRPISFFESFVDIRVASDKAGEVPVFSSVTLDKFISGELTGSPNESPQGDLAMVAQRSENESRMQQRTQSEGAARFVAPDPQTVFTNSFKAQE